MKNKDKIFLYFLLGLPRLIKQLIVLLCDISLIIISIWLSFFLRIDQFLNLSGPVLFISIVAILIALPIFYVFGLYKTVFRYSGKSTIISISLALTVFGLIFFSIVTIYRIDGVPRSIGIIHPMLLFILISISRLMAKYILTFFYTNTHSGLQVTNILIYGAGIAGRQIVSALENNNKIKVVGFIDDNNELHGKIIQGKNIFSSENLKKIILSKNIKQIILAIPSIGRKRRQEILEKISQNNVSVKTLPSVTDLAEGKVSTTDIHDFQIEDILNRDQVLPDFELLNKNINSKTVLVTGAGGSIGSELCRQAVKLNPKAIVLFEISEYALYKINNELQELLNKLNIKVKIIPLIGSILDKKRLNEVFSTFKPETIFHAAAYKHVSLVEENIIPSLENNVFGSINLILSAIQNKTRNFVFISSDKAVRPTNVMGASKRLAEISIKSILENSDTKDTNLSIVRFGNVLGSSGSIIPKFKKQIQDGGPVTLTHNDVTRYFMTIPEAAQLVIQASALSQSAEVFILDMGESIKIKDIIKKMISLSGLKLIDENSRDGDIEIKTIGLRPGEKLFEELLLGNDPKPTRHPKIQKSSEPYIKWNKLKDDIDQLKFLIKENQVNNIYSLLQKLVNDFNPNSKIVDVIFNNQNK